VGLYTRDPEVLGSALVYGRLRLLALPLMFSANSRAEEYLSAQ